jgi:hypothetical protein
MLRGRQMEVEYAEALGTADAAHDCSLEHRGLLVHVETGEHERHRVAVAACVVDAYLERARRRLAAHARHADTVGPGLVEPDAVEARYRVWIRVGRLAEFVDELRGHGTD